MTLDEVGNIGELIAAIATVATLVYLALQIRQNNFMLRDAAHRGIQDDADRWRAYLIENEEIAALYTRGMNDLDALHSDERLRFRMLMDQLFFAWQYAFAAAQGKLAKTQLHYLLATLARSGGKSYWELNRHVFDDEFVAYVEQHLKLQEQP